MKSLAILSLVLATSMLTAAAEQLMVESWLRSDGLPHSTVEAIAQTPDGYLWLGTRGGLARFDGVNFKNYSLADGLDGSYIAALRNDGEGGLWIGTFGGGLSRFKDAQFTTWTTADGLAHNNALLLAPAGPGAVWVGGTGGLQHFDGEQFTRAKLPDGEIYALAAGLDGEVWATIPGIGLFRIDATSVEPIAAPEHQLLSYPTAFVDRGGALWLSIDNGRVLRREAGGAWTEFDEADGLPGRFIYWFAQDDSGELWAASHNEGLYVFRGGKFERVNGIGGELPEAVRHVLPTHEGLLWVGTEGGGLCRLSKPDVDFYAIENSSPDPQGKIHGFVERNAGEFFVTSYNSGLYRGPLDAPAKVPDVTELNANMSLLTGLRMSSGQVYLGGFDLMLRIDPGSDEIHTIKTDDLGCTALAEGPDGELWMGTREGKLARMVDGVAEVVADGFSPISGLVRGADGSWWIGTQGAGLFQWRDRVLKRWTKSDGLPTNVLRTLYLDADETLWIGTGGGGLCWIEEGELRSVNRRHGLLNDFIPQILEDESGNLWLGSHAGVMRVSKQNLREVAAGTRDQLHPLVLDESDGMLVAECAGGFSPAGVNGLDGRLYFSTVTGIAAFDPHAFDSRGAQPPRSKIEQVTLGGDPPGSPAFLAGARDLEIRYTAFDYHAPLQLRFRHRLVGGGGGWVAAGDARAAQFASLPPGDYVFEVAAAGTNGVWGTPEARYAFSVAPFLWQTAWFRFATVFSLLAVGACIAWAGARLRVKRARIEAQLEQQRNQVAQLTRLATLGELSAALAHEINQPLAAILSNAQAAQRFLANGNHDPDEIGKILQDIVADDQRASGVIGRVRSILKKDAFKPQDLDLKAIIIEVLRLMGNDLHSRGISVRSELPDGLPTIHGDRLQLQQVLINLILNAAAAMVDTQESERVMTIEAIQIGAQTIEVSVSDRGHGIPPGEEESIFTPYHTTREDGLGLGLSMGRSILLTHGGKLWAENASDGRGAIFRFTLTATSLLD